MDGNKKKRNKKKKGNHNKVTDDGSTAPEQNHHAQVPGDPEARSVAVSESDVELPEKQKARESTTQVDVELQEEVKQLENERSLWMEKEVNLEEKIRLLQSQIDECTQKELILEEKLNDLRIRNDSTMQKQVILDNKVKQIEGIEDSWNRKEVILDNKVKQIEGVEDSWNQKEILLKEMITRLDADNKGLQLQVMELKESRGSLLQENQQLKENMSTLELRIQCLERDASFHGSSTVKISEQFPKEKGPLYEMEAANETLVNKLAGEIAVPEKVADDLPNEEVDDLRTDPDQHVASEPSPTKLDRVHSRPSPPGEYASEYGENTKSLERIHEAFGIHNSTEDISVNTGVRQVQLPELDESRISADIVSVPLDDIRVQNVDPQATKSDEDSPVPLTDAPLIGAPFRLITYFAKYVSGADLVDQNRSN